MSPSAVTPATASPTRPAAEARSPSLHASRVEASSQQKAIPGSSLIMNPNQLRSLDGLAVFGGGATTAKNVSHATVAVVIR